MKRLQTLALEQKEDARHGDATFPIQKYITSLKPDYPVITTHWHEEAEFTLITEGDASYQIDLTSYAVEKDDLIFIPPLLLHSVSRGQSALYQSETYVFHMNFLGGNATDICSTRYLMPLTNEELTTAVPVLLTGCCVLALLLWFAALMCVINSGLALPANQAAQACQKAAQDVLPGMTAATFDETQLDSLCRYALFAAPDSSEVLATNMDAGHLQRAMENRQGKTRWHFGYTQYYMTSKLQDGTVCLLQFDYAVPYADPALRGVLPDMQTVHCILGILLLVGAVVWSTHRTGRFLTRETEKLTAAAQAVARKDLDSAVFSGAKVREYESTLQALQTMGDALTGSLQKQWAMEQRQREQIIQLSHKLKTPLTIIEGNAELLAEDDLTEEQRAQVEAILQGAEQTRTYLGKIRAEVQTPLRYKRNVE